MAHKVWRSKLYTQDFEEADELREKYLRAGYTPPEGEGNRQVKILRCGLHKQQFVVKTKKLRNQGYPA